MTEEKKKNPIENIPVGKRHTIVGGRVVKPAKPKPKATGGKKK